MQSSSFVVQPRIKKVVCAVSGGVDSAVAAFLLKKKGYEVQGVFMKNWDIADETGTCMASKDLEDAKQACEIVGIPLKEVNFVKQYWHDVFTNMISDYQNGFTPNPDILCNKHIKFSSFLKYVGDNFGCDYVATGHYVRTCISSDLTYSCPSKYVRLLKGVDPVKDQSFFLSQVSQNALKQMLFPLGSIVKDNVRKIACDNGLKYFALKKESMGICFIGSRRFQKFISDYVEPQPGTFVDIDTRAIVGKHTGIHQWTIGQRCKLGGLKKAYFVASKDKKSKCIFVASGTDHPSLFKDIVMTDKPHWICQEPSYLKATGMKCEFRFQHTEPFVECLVKKDAGNQLVVHLASPLRAVTPGQYAVFYLGEECLGSARILESLNSQNTVGLVNEMCHSSEMMGVS